MRNPEKLYMIKGRYSHKTYHNWKTIKNKVSSSDTIVEFNVGKEYTLEELEKQIKRDQDLHNLLGDGTSYPTIHHSYVRKMVTDHYDEQEKNNQRRYYYGGNFKKTLGVSFTEKEFKETLSTHKSTLLSQICKTTEDYVNVIKVVNFRLGRYDRLEDDNVVMFNQAKENIKKERIDNRKKKNKK